MKLCLIGSTRFIDLFNEANQRLTLMGHVVYSVAWSTSQHRGDGISPEQKEVLDLVHLRKISESDGVVLVTDDTGYFGDSTRREIIWSQMNHKLIYSIQDVDLLLGPSYDVELLIESMKNRPERGW